MIKRLLIANRGEIACRIIKTAKEMGIVTIAIYSDADAKALHVQSADEAWHVGGASSGESYLNIENVISAAKKAEADAIHPGYGFLSENMEFARACENNKIIFVGPPASAIEAMGSKSRAKQIMEKANVPLVPGYHGEDQNEKILLKAATAIGFPVMLKAAAGGGGKAMRRVDSLIEFPDALNAVKREAKAYFNDDKVLLEKYLSKPRHIEIQVFADTKGNFVHLFERDCSIQRRHQKVVEEAPASDLSDALREQIANTAISSAKAIGYIGAGTVEFLLDENWKFYFMEMNTRLQVEHPITEMITGCDLVKWQLDVASGSPLPLQQDQIHKRGHAIEVRLYAEDPQHQFLPSIGAIQHLSWPSTDVRIDTGFQAGDVISPWYDPMLAKLIVHGENRESALLKLAMALKELQIVGIKTNRQFLLSVITHPEFISGIFDTGFIEKHQAHLLEMDIQVDLKVLAKVVLFHILNQQTQPQLCMDPHSPWNIKDSWRPNLISELELLLRFNHQTYMAKINFHGDHYKIEINSKIYHLDLIKISSQLIVIECAGQIESLPIIQQDNRYYVFREGKDYCVEIIDPIAEASESVIGNRSMMAPMPGTVIHIAIEAGARVAKGEKILTLEAMKMEHCIYAPSNGTVKELLFCVGDMVAEGKELVIFEPEGEA